MNETETLYNWRFEPAPGTAPHILFILCYAILGITPDIRANTALPRPTSNHIATRLAFYAGRILVLILRLTPNSCGAAFMRPTRTSNVRTPDANMPQPTPPQAPRAPRATPAKPLSARQAAARLAHYLASVEALAAQAGHPLSDKIRTLIAQAREALGCSALAPAQPPLAARNPPPAPLPTHQHHPEPTTTQEE